MPQRSAIEAIEPAGNLNLCKQRSTRVPRRPAPPGRGVKLLVLPFFEFAGEVDCRMSLTLVCRALLPALM